MRSSGPGGQSVNTTNSKAELRLKINECAPIDENIMKNLK
jgi:protein subunit release factor B